MAITSDDGGIRKLVSELNGYLNAISHLNDEVGYRHHFAADLVAMEEGIDEIGAIRRYLKNRGEPNAAVEEITARQFNGIVKEHIFNNFLLSKNIDKFSKLDLSFVKEQLAWHVLDYVTLAKEYGPVGRYLLYRSEAVDGKTDFVFIIIGNKLLMMFFHHLKEDVG